MTHAEAVQRGQHGGLVTSARYGTKEIRCPVDGSLCEKKTCFTVERARKAGRKGIRVMQAKYSVEQRRAWAKLGGRKKCG